MECEDNPAEIPIENGESMKNLCLEGNSTSMQEDPSASGMTIYAEDITAEEAKKLRGDAIGDTAYSEKFVLELLLNLQAMKWNKELEQQFVNLWDMTEEKEVCDFLLSFNFPTLVAQIVPTYYNECRLIEILMGILSNIAFVCKEAMVVSADEMKIFVDLFYCDNVGVLTQVVNFFGHVWSENVLINFVDGEFFKRISFILVNSLNCELLYEMLSCLAIMCVDPKISEALIFEDPSFLKYCIKAYKQVFIDEQKDNGATFTLRQYNCFYNLMCIVTYVSSLTLSDQLKTALNLTSESLLRKTTIMFKFFSRDQETLESLHQPETLFKGLLFFLFVVDPVPYHGNLFKSLLKILINSSQSQLPQNSLLDLVLYFICGTENYEQLRGDCLEVGKRRTLYVLEKFASIKNEWNFGDKILCAQNLHRLNDDLKELLNK